ncbi:MAG: DEAD/DEAH box helicase [bacterium]|nr:DEAD/DEAH box helicase [bacterium]
MKFTEFDLNEKLMQGIADAGFTECMPVQEETLVHSLKTKDVEVQSQTGTGKTAAFLITIFQHFLDDDSPIKDKKALIIAPTRELAVQIEKDAKMLGRHLDFTIGSFYGGVGYATQEKLLRDDVNLIIGTPGRLLDFNHQGKMDLRKVGFLVLDEADRMLDMGFLPDIRRIMRRMSGPTRRQVMLFSATLDVNTRSIAREFMDDPVAIAIEPEQVTVDKITQVIYHVSEQEKMSLILGILNRDMPKNALIFTNMKHTAAQVSKHLEYNGYKCQYLSGDLPQSKRLRVIDSFKSGKLSYLVATDVAARGLHIEDLEMIINYDLPGDCENYVHRIGRTARAGKSGKAVSLACENFIYNLEAIESFLGMKIPVGIADEELFHEDKGAGIDFRKEIRGGSTSRSSRSRERSSHGRSAGRPKRPATRKSQDSRRSPDSKRATGSGQAVDSRRATGSGQATGSRRTTDSEVKRKRRVDKRREDTRDERKHDTVDAPTSAKARGKGKGRGKTTAQTSHKEPADRRHSNSNKNKPRGRVPTTSEKTAISNFEDRLEFYRKKYGDTFSPQESAQHAPAKKTLIKKIKGIFSRKKGR